MKKRITLTIDKELLNWLDNAIANKIFSNRSHGLEFLVKNKMVENERKNNSHTGYKIS